LVIKYPLTFINYNDTKFYKNNQANFLAAHFAKRNTKFGGGGKIGIGKRGRAKIPSPQPPSFLPARAFSFCRAKRDNQAEFRSKKVRASFSNCDIIISLGIVFYFLLYRPDQPFWFLSFLSRGLENHFLLGLVCIYLYLTYLRKTTSRAIEYSQKEW